MFKSKFCLSCYHELPEGSTSDICNYCWEIINWAKNQNRIDTIQHKGVTTCINAPILIPMDHINKET